SVVDEAMDHGVHAAMVAIDQHAKGRALARQHRFHRASLDGARLRLVFSIGPDGCTTEGATRIHPVCMLSRDSWGRVSASRAARTARHARTSIRWLCLHRR